MAGCSIIFILFIILPMFFVLCFLALGIVAGCFITAIFSGILLLILSQKGFFQKYKEAEEGWKRYGSLIIKILLILTFVGSILFATGSSAILAYLLSGK